MVAAKHPEQTNIPGTEPPSVPEIDAALRQWQNAKAEQKDIAESVRLKHSLLIARLVESKLERYSYVDEATGKRRMLFVEREPKAKTKTAPKPATSGKKRGRNSKPDDDGVDTADVSDRDAKPPKEHSDPFGSARRAVADRDAEVTP